MRQDGPAKLVIQIKSDWLLICFSFVTKSPGCVESTAKKRTSTNPSLSASEVESSKLPKVKSIHCTSG